MKTAYFIMLHHKPYQFRWLLEALYSPDDLFCLHVDSMAPRLFHDQVRALVHSRKNVMFLTPRNVIWGGWSLVSVELAAMQHMLAADQEWKYFVNLSGQDYPVKPLAYMKEKLSSSWPLNFIRVCPFAQVRQAEPMTRILPGIWPSNALED